MLLVPTKAILLEVPDEVLIERVTGRRLDPETGKIYHMTFSPPPPRVISRLTQRADDTEEALRSRLASYAKNKAAVAAAFAEVAKEVDGNRKPDDVWADIREFLTE